MKQRLPPNTRPGAGLGPVAVWALVWALVLAPSLGRWHQVLHSHGPAPSAAVAPDAAATVVAGSAPAEVRADERGFLERLFSGHARADCWLLDQTALGDALPSTALSLPAVLAPHTAPAQGAEGVAHRHVAHFQARGPPPATA